MPLGNIIHILWIRKNIFVDPVEKMALASLSSVMKKKRMNKRVATKTFPGLLPMTLFILNILANII